MTAAATPFARLLGGVLARCLPFADSVGGELSRVRLLRLSLFQVSVGMAMVLVYGVLNRVMVVELGVDAWIVATMLGLPLLVAPLRALIGFRSDTHRSFLGWRRVPYLWFGSMLQFGGLAIMPFALLLLAGQGVGSPVYGQVGAAVAFLLVGAGLHTVQTTGLALATDLAPPARRPRVVAALYSALLLGTLASALVFSALLADFSALRLVQVIQGAAVATLLMNGIALWKQEARRAPSEVPQGPRPSFRAAWTRFVAAPRARRFLFAVAVGSAGFGMQDILLEAYGGQMLGLPVSGTTLLTALSAIGAFSAFLFAGRSLARGAEPCRLAGLGVVSGIVALLLVMLALPFTSPALLGGGALLLGFGSGLFVIGTVTVATGVAADGLNGLVLGAWGTAQAAAAGCAVAGGGALRDLTSELAATGYFGATLSGAATGYLAVYQLEIVVLFLTLVVLGPLVGLGSGARGNAVAGRLNFMDPPARDRRSFAGG